ncbi:hypothetical protein HUO13_37130 [Saccharopolyspora erythraea]|uniref:hypothetical protein n=1 Tax=Saccharopolyspora erythraea TaxID=1836 RepID=UPI001BA85978|nr:hypothetical protein [Saccharopolyspora erythraea]QUH06518.1 hypothetical protein HUO13_37130 [Saccharopolyspora erythraea]
MDLLADFQAGVLDQETADRVRVQVEEDPEAREILAALDATTADLGDLPPLSIPDDVSARIDAALEEEVRAWSQQAPASQQSAPEAQSARVVDFAEAKRRRRRRFTAGAGVLAAAAAVAGIVVFSVGGGPYENAAQPPSGTSSGRPPLAFQGEVSLSPAQFSEALNGEKQYAAALADPAKLVGCLQANGVQGSNPLGAREVTLDGRPAQLLILSSGEIGRFRLLTVGTDCGPGNPATLSDTAFGG